MPLGTLGNRHAMTQMTQKPVALVLERTPSPWCSSARTASHAMTQMTQRRRPTRAVLELERCRLMGRGRPAPGWRCGLAAAGWRHGGG